MIPARARRIAVSCALAAFALFALRMAFVPLGEAVLVVVQHRPGDLLVSGGELLIYLMAAMIAGGAFVRRRPDGATIAFAAVTLLGVAGLGFAPRYLAGIGPPHARLFHGIYTPASDWTDFSVARPRLEYHVNRLGFRGPDWSEHKAPGIVRIALVGDSFVFGMGVPDGDTLKARLDEGLAARGLAGRVEVLNLGLCGNNLGTHLRMYEIARDRLGADVVVMGLFVHNDLAEWDQQDELRGVTRIGGFSLLAWLAGYDPAVALATLAYVQHGDVARHHAALDRLLPRLDALRAAEPRPIPLLVLPFHDTDKAIAPRFIGKANLIYLAPPPEVESNYIPNDGHPSAAGDRAFAAVVLDALDSLPAIRAVAPPIAPR